VPNNAEMANVRLARVTSDRITVAELTAAVRSDAAGATVVFSGDVRSSDHGREVVSLTYEGHPSAEQVLTDVAAGIAQEFPVLAVAVAHRLGPIPIGEAALIAVVSAQHRGEAFAACTELVERVKEHIPVWKHQAFADGTDEWVNCA
jgi:molybdopterin synthase catalytic subunit